MKTILSLLILLQFSQTVFATSEPRPGFDWDEVSLLAIQERGRLKPLDTFARESLQFITGKTSWNGLSAIECLFGWLTNFDKEWENEALIHVDYEPLKKELGLDVKERFFTLKAIRENDQMSKKVRQAAEKERTKERLSDLEKKLLSLANQKNVLEMIISGEVLTILPNPKNKEDAWFSLTALNEPGALPYNNEQMQGIGMGLKSMIEGFINKDASLWKKGVNDFHTLLQTSLSNGNYPKESDLKLERHYNHLRPFRWAWVLYSAAFVLLLSVIVTKNSVLKYTSIVVLLSGFLLHIYGFVIRCMISGRPPVTNMYESVIWVTWGCVLFSLIIWSKYKNLVIPAAAVVFSIVGLVLADNTPVVLDPSIHPLEPVLRSNLWLTIHVLTITLSYAAFALSLCLGNVVLGFYLLKPQGTETIQQYTLYMYRAMQIGVVLLAAGTILGGVWADYSWGRFWGWDPKEVWALTALLLYLAVLHGRFSGWLRGFGFAATTVVSFLGVMMAWYGVNFVLGAGLHSYGFGSGGTAYVVGYIIAQVGFILLSYFQYKKSGVKYSAIFPKQNS